MTSFSASAHDSPQKLYTVTADGGDWMFAIGGKVNGRSLVQDTQPIGIDAEAEIAAAINGDHFSFATGVPLGMSVSGGRIVTSPVEPYDADEYFFHALGITADGDVLTGENPTLYMQCTVGDTVITIDRINRTRELWEGAEICLYTPDYGVSTDTDSAGVEFVIRVTEGDVAAGSALKGVVEAVDEDGDAPIEEGTVVLSISLLRYSEAEYIAIGDEVEFYFSFEEQAWNEVEFAVGGNLTIVRDGEPLTFDYTLGVFAAPQPRSAIGVKEDGTLVMVAVDGRSDEAGGLTANDMANYMAVDMGCEHAILLDGGGSTALCAATGESVLETVNVPSEERPVGNAVLLVNAGAQGMPTDTVLWIVCGAVVMLVIAATTLILIRICRKP